MIPGVAATGQLGGMLAARIIFGQLANCPGRQMPHAGDGKARLSKSWPSACAAAVLHKPTVHQVTRVREFKSACRAGIGNRFARETAAAGIACFYFDVMPVTPPDCSANIAKKAPIKIGLGGQARA